MDVAAAIAMGAAFLEVAGFILDAYGTANDIADLIDGDTAIYWGSVVEGTAKYNYVDENGIDHTNISASFCFGENLPFGTKTFVSPYLDSQVYYYNTGSNSGAGSLSFSSPNVQYSYLRYYPSGDMWYKTTMAGQPDYRLSGAQLLVSDYASTPTWQYGTVPTEMPILGKAVVNGVTSADMHSHFPNAVYVPISGGTHSYNDIRSMVVTWVNDNIDASDDPITIDDLPTWDEIIAESTEPTESTENSGGLNIDYDEILSEKELESILNQDSYAIDTIDNLSLSLEDVPEMPSIQAVPADVVQVAGLVTDKSTDFIASVGLDVIYVPLIIFAVVVFCLRGGH